MVNISGSKRAWGLISEKPWIHHWLEFELYRGEFATNILSFIIRANELKEFSINLFVSMFFHHEIACLLYFLLYHCLFFRVCNLFTACMHANTVLRDILIFLKILFSVLNFFSFVQCILLPQSAFYDLIALSNWFNLCIIFQSFLHA